MGSWIWHLGQHMAEAAFRKGVVQKFGEKVGEGVVRGDGEKVDEKSVKKVEQKVWLGLRKVVRTTVCRGEG